MQPLSELEQKLYFQLEAADTLVVSAADIAQFLGISQAYARQVAFRLVKKQAFELIKPGLYARIPASVLINKGQYNTDPILIASKLVEPYFLSFYTAFSLHGIAQQPIYTTYITSPKLLRAFSYGDFSFHPVKVIPKRFFGYEPIEYRGKKVWVSDLERTILDAFDRPQLCGGWQEIIQCLQDLDVIDIHMIDWDKLLDYIDHWSNKALVHRLGYVFSQMQKQKQKLLQVPDNFLQSLKKRKSSSLFYFHKGQKGKLVRDWNLIVEPNLNPDLASEVDNANA
jgi:predicted transcriptional regulator of viral defense system